jgi:hypothetical protein
MDETHIENRGYDGQEFVNSCLCNFRVRKIAVRGFSCGGSISGRILGEFSFPLFIGGRWNFLASWQRNPQSSILGRGSRSTETIRVSQIG